MDTNILVGIKNIINASFLLSNHSKSLNRINNMGESLEEFIKDIFCGSLNEISQEKKNQIYSDYFSYTGNQNNPPDIMIRDGDAIEVKKIESNGSSIALNSSYPKNKLYANSPMITSSCRIAEVWTEKDILYTLGSVKEGKLKSLWFVYGDCFAADKEVYERIKNKISYGLAELRDIELSETNEIGRVNKVDPLGITNLRIRGMWQIDHPNKVFNYLSNRNSNNSDFSFKALILEDKYNSFPKIDRDIIENLNLANLVIEDVKIKSPDNPAKLLNAKFITFYK